MRQTVIFFSVKHISSTWWKRLWIIGTRGWTSHGKRRLITLQTAYRGTVSWEARLTRSKHTLLTWRLRPWHRATIQQSSIRCCHGNSPRYLFSDIIAKAQEQNTEETAITDPFSAGQHCRNVNTWCWVKPVLKCMKTKQRERERGC